MIGVALIFTFIAATFIAALTTFTEVVSVIAVLELSFLQQIKVIAEKNNRLNFGTDFMVYLFDV